jgi:hypothetical protein
MAVAGMPVDLRRAATPDLFAAAGLAKLSPEELQVRLRAPESIIEPGMPGYFWPRIPDGALRVKV